MEESVRNMPPSAIRLAYYMAENDQESSVKALRTSCTAAFTSKVAAWVML